MKKYTYSILLFLLIGLASCQNETEKGQGKHPGLNTSINTNIPVDEFEKKLMEDKDVQLVDVRTREEFEQGHLKGAKNHDINSSSFLEEIKELDKSKPVMVYCLSGGRSARAAELLNEQGFSEVYNMEGGIMKWNANNKPLENGEIKVQPVGLSKDDFNNLIKTEKLVLVDYNAKWCKPCKKMAPMLEELALRKKDKLTLIKIDADENKELLKEKGIESVPVLELYKNGSLIWKHEGEIDEETLISETNL